jgi:hypothetical protein
MLIAMRTALLCLFLLLPQPGTAQIYKTVDEHGNVSFSDTPPPNGPSEQIRLRETNSTPAPAIVEPLQPAQPTAAEEAAAVAYSVVITSPANETTIPMGPGNFSVNATVEPSLEQGGLLQLYVDGSPSGNPQSSNTWMLTNVFRGAHDLTVAAVDGNGNRLAESAPVRVYVLRPSVNSPNRAKPRPTPR